MNRQLTCHRKREQLLMTVCGWSSPDRDVLRAIAVIGRTARARARAQRTRTAAARTMQRAWRQHEFMVQKHMIHAHADWAARTVAGCLHRARLHRRRRAAVCVQRAWRRISTVRRAHYLRTSRLLINALNEIKCLQHKAHEVNKTRNQKKKRSKVNKNRVVTFL